jgi:hypothetical protein
MWHSLSVTTSSSLATPHFHFATNLVLTSIFLIRLCGRKDQTQKKGVCPTVQSSTPLATYTRPFQLHQTRLDSLTVFFIHHHIVINVVVLNPQKSIGSSDVRGCLRRLPISLAFPLFCLLMSVPALSSLSLPFLQYLSPLFRPAGAPNKPSFTCRSRVGASSLSLVAPDFRYLFDYSTTLPPWFSRRFQDDGR